MSIAHKLALGCLIAVSLAGCQGPQADKTVKATPAPGQLPTPDTCGAKDYAWLIGDNRSRVPAAPEGKVIRVVCTTCAMTMDFNASRLNVIHHEKTGVVEKLTCG